MSETNPARLARLCLALVSLAVLSSAAAIRAGDGPGAEVQPSPWPPPLKYTEISDSITMLQSERPYGSNITCFAVKEGLLFVDAGLFTEIATKFRKDMEAKYQKRTTALLLSHAHVDHFFGMGAFADVPVVAALSGRSSFEQQLSIDYKSRVEAYQRVFPKFGDALKTARLSMPGVWFDHEIQFGSGESVVLFHNTGGHSTCSSYVRSPSQGVIAAGDNVQVDAFPYFGDPTTDMNAWIATLKDWEATQAGTICPGHGRAVDGAYLTSVRVFFEDLRSALRKLKSERVGEQEAVLHPSLPKGYWGAEAAEPVWYRAAIAGLYRSLD